MRGNKETNKSEGGTRWEGGSNKEVNVRTISYICPCVYGIIYINISYIT